MASLEIRDTGYLNITDSGDPAPTLANSGTAIALKSVSVSFERAGNNDVTEIINTNTGPVVGFGSVTVGKITIKGVLDRNTAASVDTLIDLQDLLSTYGVKVIYYSDTTDGYRDITDTLGDTHKNDIHKTSLFSGTATPHLHVRFTNLQVTEDPTSHIQYVLEGVTTL